MLKLRRTRPKKDSVVRKIKKLEKKYPCVRLRRNQCTEFDMSIHGCELGSCPFDYL